MKHGLLILNTLILALLPVLTWASDSTKNASITANDSIASALTENISHPNITSSKQLQKGLSGQSDAIESTGTAGATESRGPTESTGTKLESILMLPNDQFQQFISNLSETLEYYKVNQESGNTLPANTSMALFSLMDQGTLTLTQMISKNVISVKNIDWQKLENDIQKLTSLINLNNKYKSLSSFFNLNHAVQKSQETGTILVVLTLLDLENHIPPEAKLILDHMITASNSANELLAYKLNIFSQQIINEDPKSTTFAEYKISFQQIKEVTSKLESNFRENEQALLNTLSNKEIYSESLVGFTSLSETHSKAKLLIQHHLQPLGETIELLQMFSNSLNYTELVGKKQFLGFSSAQEKPTCSKLFF